MASTRNKNTPGDYLLEQRQIGEIANYYAYENSPNGEAVTPNIAGDGLLVGRMAPTNFSFNSCEIESQLFGIGSTNLVAPKAEVMLDKKEVKSLDVIDKLPVFIPERLVLEKGQRPMYLR
jgi:hypothetical protein